VPLTEQAKARLTQWAKAQTSDRARRSSLGGKRQGSAALNCA